MRHPIFRARAPARSVWIEAYEQYLLRKNVCEKSKLERLSDDALAEKYFQYVEETNCKEDAFDWAVRWIWGIPRPGFPP